VLNWPKLEGKLNNTGKSGKGKKCRFYEGEMGLKGVIWAVWIRLLVVVIWCPIYVHKNASFRENFKFEELG
jgi:hypothetical protein